MEYICHHIQNTSELECVIQYYVENHGYRNDSDLIRRYIGMMHSEVHEKFYLHIIHRIKTFALIENVHEEYELKPIPNYSILPEELFVL